VVLVKPDEDDKPLRISTKLWTLAGACAVVSYVHGWLAVAAHRWGEDHMGSFAATVSAVTALAMLAFGVVGAFVRSDENEDER
jgi:hypothetical protein